MNEVITLKIQGFGKSGCLYFINNQNCQIKKKISKVYANMKVVFKT